MKVIRAKVLGFCMGVQRAVNIALELPEQPDSGASSLSGKVYTLGPLIHNAKVQQVLMAKGISCLEESKIPAVPEASTVIIRAHGISPAIEDALIKRGLRILDATCPHVKTSQSKARVFAERGYHVFLAGEKNHAEIIGVQGFVPEGQCSIAGNPAEAETAAVELFRLEPKAQTALIGQTTINPYNYRAIGERIRQFFPSLEIVHSICSATGDRQEALRELCGNVDAVIIAGGRESANTRQLFLLAGELGKPAWLLESVKDIPREIAAFKTVGLSAGASTPDELIDEIEAALISFS